MIKAQSREQTEKNSPDMPGTLRIAMLGHKRIPSLEGGVEVVVEQLATRMAQFGHRVTCYNRRGHHVSGAEFDRAARKEYKGVRCVEVFTLDKKGLAAMTSSFSASVRAAFGRYDVVHVHAEGPAAFCWLPKLLGKRVIVTVHGLDHQRAKWGKFARWYILTGEKNAVRFADEIIVLSRGVQRYFRETYGRKTVYIPNGVERLPCRPASGIAEKWGLEKDGYLLFLGRVVPEKGIRYLIEAFRNVRTDKKLVIAGGSSDTDAFLQEMRALARGDERVLFTGFVQGAPKEELYSNAYLYTLPSDVEGMPLSLLEALSYGNCCLTSDIPECAEVTDGGQPSFRRGDTEDLRQKLQGLCDDPAQVAAYREKAARILSGRYDWDVNAEETLRLYRPQERVPARKNKGKEA